MKKAILILLFLSSCANNQPHQNNSNRGTMQDSIPIQSSGLVSAPIGKIDTPQIGLNNNETRNQAGGNINQAEIIIDAYRTIVWIVLAFSGIIIIGFLTLIVILTKSHQKHVRDIIQCTDSKKSCAS